MKPSDVNKTATFGTTLPCLLFETAWDHEVNNAGSVSAKQLTFRVQYPTTPLATLIADLDFELASQIEGYEGAPRVILAREGSLHLHKHLHRVSNVEHRAAMTTFQLYKEVDISVSFRHSIAAPGLLLNNLRSTVQSSTSGALTSLFVTWNCTIQLEFESWSVVLQ